MSPTRWTWAYIQRSQSVSFDLIALFETCKFFAGLCCLRSEARMPVRTSYLSTAPIPMLAAAFVLFLPLSLGAQSNNPKSQTVYLPDPTPRETDPHLVLGDTSPLGAQDQGLVDQQNAKRRELIEWAANKIVTLSEQVRLDVMSPKTPSSMALAAADAAKIEQLAKNLSTALKAR